MSIKSDILEKYNLDYMAEYGWQSNFDDETFTFGYIYSYKSNADLLINKGTLDLHIFPIIFSYRQYLELVLKNVCYKNMTRNQYIKLIRYASHNLIKVWQNAKEFLKKNITPKQLNEIEEIIRLFYDLDPNSYTFRYEYDKKLNRSIKNKSLIINTFELKKWMNTIDSYLRFTYDDI